MHSIANGAEVPVPNGLEVAVERGGGISRSEVTRCRDALLDLSPPICPTGSRHPEVDGSRRLTASMHLDEGADELVERGSHRGGLQGGFQQHERAHGLGCIDGHLNGDRPAAGVGDDVRGAGGQAVEQMSVSLA